MNWILLAALTAIISLAVGAPTVSEVSRPETCKDGDTWKEDCNNCWCDNGRPACTLMACITRPSRSADCKPGTVWIKMTDNDEGCAKFKCHADGTVTSKPHFTREMCPSEPEFVEDDDDDDHQQQQHQVTKREAGCKPGTVWIKMTDNDEGCAKFKCHSDGTVTSKPHFTREMCPSEPEFVEDDDEEQQQQQHVSKREAGCKPGTTWIKMTDNDEGCAKFKCHADGTVTSKPHFTREMCPSEPEFVEDDDDDEQQQQQQHVSKREAGCKPGTTWIKMTDNDEGCAKFKCHADGTVTSKPHFTREMCPSEPEFVEDDDDEQQQQQQHVSKREASGCKPGDKWMEDCNECTCNEEGKGSCTRMLCEKDADEIPWLSEQDGQQQQQHTKREASCKPGTTWIKMTDNDEGCAKFKCHADGTVTSKPHFTREMCPSEPEFVEDDDDDEQQQQQHVSKREAGCKPGDKWMEDCNECTCNEEGKGSCTRMLCEKDADEIPWLSEQDGQQQQQHSKREARCKAGDKWMEDCNECTCNEEGKGSCTRMLCEKDADEIPWLSEQEDQQQQQQHQHTKRETSCKPGTTWIKMTDNDEGCAKFKCHADGTVTSKPHFTREMCPSEPEFVEDDDDDEQQQQQHVSKREAGCKPGDKWMEDCNECTCNEEGKGSCTRMLCEKDADEIPWLSEQEGQQQQQHTKREARMIRNRRWQAPPIGCKDGETYFDGCNTCVCSNNGPPTCTYKICPPDSQVQTVNFSQLPEKSQQNVQQAS